MTDRLSFSDGSRINTSLGYIGGHLSIGIAELSFSIDQDGVRSGGLSWTGWGVVSIDGNAESWGWNTPTPLFQLGQEFTSSGTYGTFSVGHPVAGLNFGVHENNPPPGIGPGSGRVFERVDANGDVIGFTFYHEERSAQHGWQYRIVTTDVYGNQIGLTRIEPMPVENQLNSAIRCFPADTPIAISLTETRPISDIRVGDTVLAFDPAKVVRLYRNMESWRLNVLASLFEVVRNIILRRKLRLRLISSAALFPFLYVNAAFAEIPVVDDSVNISCFFSVRCEVGSADCELMSGTRTYSFAYESSIDVPQGFSVFASTERSHGIVLTILNSGEARMLEFRTALSGATQSVGHVSFGRCEYAR